MAVATLDAIIKKVRLLTRRPSVTGISDADITEYVNTFILYDFPVHLKLDTLKTNLDFWTIPNIDRYTTETVGLGAPNNSLVNLKNAILQVQNPVYVDGYQVWLVEDQNLFYNSYPKRPQKNVIATGDGITTVYAGNLSPLPILSGETTFSSFSIFDENMAGTDSHIDRGVGSGIASVGTAGFGATGNINYLTGAYNVTFDNAPAAGQNVYASFVTYQPTRPQAILYFQNEFILRPVPDKTYKVELEVYIRPTELMAAGAVPDLEQWWQWIAYGAAKKIFEDASDLQSIQDIMPEYKNQERLCLRKTLGNLSTQRVATIYNFPNQFNSPFNYWNWGGPF